MSPRYQQVPKSPSYNVILRSRDFKGLKVTTCDPREGSTAGVYCPTPLSWTQPGGCSRTAMKRLAERFPGRCKSAKSSCGIPPHGARMAYGKVQSRGCFLHGTRMDGQSVFMLCMSVTLRNHSLLDGKPTHPLRRLPLLARPSV